MTSGKLIVFEGIDNAGKTTVSRDLATYLRRFKVDVELASEMASPIGAIISDFFQTRRPFSPLLKTLLFAADRAMLVEEIILPSLARGATVIVDRYYYSALVYRQAEGFGLDYVHNVNRVFPRPDITILIDIDPTESARRGLIHRKESYYDTNLLEKVRKAYLDLAPKENFVIVNGMCNLSKLKNRVRSTVLIRLGYKE